VKDNRRALHGGVVHLGEFAHSALLLQTKSKYYICEYMNDALVHLYSVTVVVTKTHEKESYQDITIDNVSWTKQLKGEAPAEGWTPPKVKKAMEGVMSKGYSVWTSEHCHTAQERTRELMKSKPSF